MPPQTLPQQFWSNLHHMPLKGDIRTGRHASLNSHSRCKWFDPASALMGAASQASETVLHSQNCLSGDNEGLWFFLEWCLHPERDRALTTDMLARPLLPNHVLEVPEILKNRHQREGYVDLITSLSLYTLWHSLTVAANRLKRDSFPLKSPLCLPCHLIHIDGPLGRVWGKRGKREAGGCCADCWNECPIAPISLSQWNPFLLQMGELVNVLINCLIGQTSQITSVVQGVYNQEEINI